MADHGVTVTYNPSLAQPWSFDKKTTTLKHNGTVTLSAAQGSTWTFLSATVPSGMSWSLQGGNKLVITDDIVENGTRNSWIYTVTITLADGTQKTSPSTPGSAADVGVPPVIQNDGGQDPKGGKK